jgi:hypothetical protein
MSDYFSICNDLPESYIHVTCSPQILKDNKNSKNVIFIQPRNINGYEDISPKLNDFH